MATKKTRTKKASNTKSTEQLRKEAIASIDKNLDGDAKPKRGSRNAVGSRPKAAHANGKLSGLDAAAQILGKAKEPMGCKDMVEHAITQGLWSPGGKTPHATLYAAIIREISKKGKGARFEKVDRGRFQLAR